MFGNNEIVGKSWFKQADKNELFVTSRFFTLQGEGPFRGHPACFIRLAKCNLACSFCDTSFDSGEWISFDCLLDETEQLIVDFFASRSLPVPAWASGTEKKMVLVITGGEPSLQSNVSSFLEKAASVFQHTQIESNGTMLLPALPKSTTLVVSPKCFEKDKVVVRYLQPNKQVLERADCLKFVMSSPEHKPFTPYSDIPIWAHEWASKTGKPVFVSPMNCYNHTHQRNEVTSFWEPGLLDMEQNRRNHEYAAEYCMKSGFILNLQLHLFASLP